MKLRFAICVLPWMLLTGCRSGHQGNSELLERELRFQEDGLYEMEDALHECQAMLESSRRENQALKNEIAGGDKGPAADVPPARLPARSQAPSRSATPPVTEELPNLQPPVVEPGEPVGPSGESASPTSFKPAGRRAGFTLSGELKLGRGPASEIVLNRQLTGGWNADGCPGDEGVMVVFEPRNAKGELVESLGDVSIVLLDPASQGAAARVARWDFTADEAAIHFKKTALGKGLHFNLPWPSDPPIHTKLHLFARLTTPRGEKLVADQMVQIDLLPEVENTVAKSPEWIRATPARQLEIEAKRATAQDEPDTADDEPILVRSMPAREEANRSDSHPLPSVQPRHPKWSPNR